MRRPLARALGAALLVLLSLAGALLPTVEAEAASAVQLRTWVADPSGSDTRSNSHLNKETIVLTNTTSKSVAMAGYRLKDAQNHTFVFPKGFTLKARASVTVHTGSGTNTGGHLYWKQKNYVWNNTGDTATLLKPTGSTALDRCTYKKVSSGTVKC
ncbi:lamin tail domain-containing protein [Auraticoccus monumenti]|uniref:Lamin Tail Domain n=1 Tax=Auraticoccus monumenti TaxID=675864 RepID=A0A1G6TUP3_9ACTN|nr:lamin tail domain-containing protein [Auraticoccus monumenti]SDD32186.1 Lamin Tail Domain [Auraticoccus monumenti]